MNSMIVLLMLHERRRTFVVRLSVTILLLDVIPLWKINIETIMISIAAFKTVFPLSALCPRFWILINGFFKGR